jgi:hypothetical protein
MVTLKTMDGRHHTNEKDKRKRDGVVLVLGGNVVTKIEDRKTSTTTTGHESLPLS